MAKVVNIYWSHQSPYCYFALDRILALNARQDVDVILRLVLPGVLRIPDVFADAPEIEQRYFALDVHRTAAFLDLPYGEARPNPVEFESGTLFRAAQTQPRLYRLYYLTAAAIEHGRGWAFLDQVTRLIWDGTTRDWYAGNALQSAIERAGLNHSELTQRADEGVRGFDAVFVSNHEALLASGHWGVPTFVYEGEPFFGQDRFDQLLWRMGIDE